ncbi:MAG TPA: hypothetical protein VG276_23475 [Actinomycetes bacterium]|jgi:hypothetical protein|nr:hypothetical protein [Actinomycetes bacterium]
MNQWWAIPMLISGGLFAGGVVSIAWERVPAWRQTELSDFRAAFAYTLRRVDRVQPALLAICLVSTIGFALNAGGAARTAAVLAAAGFLVVLLGSAAWLVPIQRRLVASGSQPPSSELQRLSWPGARPAAAAPRSPPRSTSSSTTPGSTASSALSWPVRPRPSTGSPGVSTSRPAKTWKQRCSANAC